MAKKITKNERVVLRYLTNTQHKVSLSKISDETGLSEAEVKTAITYLDQNALLPEVSKVRSGKWGKSNYQLLNRYASPDEIIKQMKWDCRNLRRDIIKFTKKVINSNKHPEIIAMKETLVQTLTEMNNSVALANLGQIPVKNI